MDPDQKKLMEELLAQGMSIRGMARKFGLNVKTVRRALARSPRPQSKPKLEPFEPKALELAERGWRGPRILRELCSLGYTGSRTILLAFLRQKRGARKPPVKVKRRFETGPGVECQIDWSPFRVPIGGVDTLVHCFSMIFAYSRKQFIAFYRNEKLPTLLHAHVEALAYFGGCCHRHVYDNMSTVSLGRVRGKPLWNPAFLQFAAHYGFTPFACNPRDPDRKGKIERPFPYIFDDFLKDTSFASGDDLNARARTWLETVANVRPHGTTHQRPVDLFAEEKDCLIRLPATPYPTGRPVVRRIQVDGCILVDASFYPVPGGVPGKLGHALVYPDRVDILSDDGRVIASHKMPDRPSRIFTPWEPRPKSDPSASRSALETKFLAFFPGAEAFLEGLHLRMKSLLPIHLRHIQRLVSLYGVESVRAALDRAHAYRNFSALALERILQKAHPNTVAEPPASPLTLGPAALGALDDVDSGSPQDYTLDTDASSDGDAHEPQE